MLFRQTYEYFVLFNKVAFSNRLGFLWMLVLPAAVFIAQHASWFAHKPTIPTYDASLAGWWGYVVLGSSVNGVGLSLLQMRESGFLKMFRFVGGHAYTVAAGQIASMLFYTLVNVTLLTAATSPMSPVPFFALWPIAMLACTISFIPVAIFFCLIPSLPVRVQSISPLLNVLIAPLVYLAFVDGYRSFPITREILDTLNPIVFVMRLTSALFTVTGLGSSMHADTLPVIAVGVFYLMIGLIGLRSIRVISTVLRT
ncbi:hypothetical protein IW967_10165 [Alicyclobacillus mali]|uniref:ABC-2 type transport system permease protein n=1 Tax=Alicyclobacillus mali (ex Roth et al. 2021) TaxID=1123961 RepID=A0ABS0F4M9_9BACL|nr:hypothetical protein [Alicyclobacillus mali (ex Roth et al. 2021)]MBF8378224.1 hypothetical protein [Alicyclobacillus mali (ex Roth et al. 2021)]MCL6487625.1 hypothetical protein [Alicyclobacillus mali (ex Roth et al. 2021)]